MKDIDTICHDKLLVILHTACSEIRRFIQIEHNQRAYDLADSVEFIPEQMLRWRPDCCQSIREALRSYQAKYTGNGFDYLALLDMDDAVFRNSYPAVDAEGAEKEAVQGLGS
jgi:hypothetical protein